MKKCTKCGELKDINCFCKKADTPDGHRTHCRACISLYMGVYVVKNKERIRQQKKEQYTKNKEKISKYAKKYREKNKEKIILKSREYRKRKVDNLSDVYIRQRLTARTSLKSADIPAELIEAKREQLRIKRYVNDLQAKDE